MPKGVKHHNWLPTELETFAKSDKERSLIALQRAFRIIGSPLFFLRTPKEQVGICRRPCARRFGSAIPEGV